MRKRGIKRLHHLLDVVEVLFAERANQDISLAQIAERAEVPLASVYHFLPSKNAAFVSLAQRFNEEFYQMATMPMDPPPDSWQEVIAFKAKRSATFLNARPAALRLFLGAGVSVEVRATHFAGDSTVARSRVKFFDAYFQMPFIPDFENKIAIAIALQDGIWSLSYGRFGHITPEFVTASIEGAVSYLRCYLPQHLVPKNPTPAELAAMDVLAEN